MNSVLLKHIFVLVLVTVFTSFPHLAKAEVTPVAGGFQVTYDINLTLGSSNGNDIEDTTIFEWNAAGDFSIDTGFTIAGKHNTVLSHVISFEPDFALVLGWGAAIPGVGDEKNHLFSLVNHAFSRHVTGKKWSAAFPGVPPKPRTGHNAMIGLLQDAASGDTVAIDALTDFVKREAGPAAFDPAANFRVIEWTIGNPIDTPPAASVPTIPFYLLIILMLGLMVLAGHFSRLHRS